MMGMIQPKVKFIQILKSKRIIDKEIYVNLLFYLWSAKCKAGRSNKILQAQVTPIEYFKDISLNTLYCDKRIWT